MKTIRRNVTDFKFGKELGEGSYSTVILATDKISGKQYAVKVLDKRHIIEKKSQVCQYRKTCIESIK